jgi:DNA-binding transcriptional regulator YhcF (GntR family)
MSFTVSRWAWQQQAEKSTSKLLLLALADRADDNGFSFPSVPRLSFDTGLNPKTITTALAHLEQLGLLLVHRIRGQQNSYQLLISSNVKNGGSDNKNGVAGDVKKGVSTNTKTGLTAATETGLMNISVKPIKKPTTTTQKPAACGGVFAEGDFVLPKALNAEQAEQVKQIIEPLGADAQSVADVLAVAMKAGQIKKNPIAFTSALVRRYHAGSFDASTGFSEAAYRKAVAARQSQAMATKPAVKPSQSQIADKTQFVASWRQGLRV